MDEVVVREASRADVAAIAALREAWVGGATADPTLVGRLERWWDEERDRRTTWLAERGGEPLGMASLVEYRRMPQPGRPDSRWGYVSTMFVLPPWRGRGTGARLLAAVIGAADARAHVRLVLSPSDEATAFYARAGFVVADGSSSGVLLVRAARPT